MDRNDIYKAFAASTRYGNSGIKWDKSEYKYQKSNIPKASGFINMNQLVNSRNLLTGGTVSILSLDTIDYLRIAPALSHLSDVNREYAFNNLQHLYLLLYQEHYYLEGEVIKESHIDRAFNKLITYNYFLKTKGMPHSLPSKLSKNQRILLNNLDMAFDAYSIHRATLEDSKSIYYTRTPQGIK